ncbi:hypothetical protein IV203_014832 [Nitzschia inconspicua]|uniref:Uncharacterized protein n=1 Tax=Nitzschia inconspicua TaxID=303405 RepID=A0A9K3LAQ2_9STRA|nr:hypothetical protein IV203_014832 [Nitzschia inconspicua]
MSNQSKSSKSPNMPRSGKDDPIEFSAGYWAMKELQSVVAFRACESVVTSGGSRSLKQLQDLVFEKYHGDLNNVASLGLAKKFMLGLEMFDGIYDTEDDPAVTGKSKKVLKYILHLHDKATIVSDPNPQAKGINMLTLSANKKTDRRIINGRVIWEMGKKVEANGRKVLAYVLNSKYKSGKIPSGEVWEDYLKFCRYKMYQDSKSKNKNKRKTTDDDSSLGVDVEPNANNTTTTYLTTSLDAYNLAPFILNRSVTTADSSNVTTCPVHTRTTWNSTHSYEQLRLTFWTVKSQKIP